jgi:hypothetical protein
MESKRSRSNWRMRFLNCSTSKTIRPPAAISDIFKESERKEKPTDDEKWDKRVVMTSPLLPPLFLPFFFLFLPLFLSFHHLPPSFSSRSYPQPHFWLIHFLPIQFTSFNVSSTRTCGSHRTKICIILVDRYQSRWTSIC